MPIQLRSELRTARKPHRCDFCEGRIEKGEKYHDEAYRYDGVYNWKSHDLCHKIGYNRELQSSCDDHGVTADDFLFFVEGATKLDDAELRTMTVTEVIQLAAKKLGVLEGNE